MDKQYVVKLTQTGSLAPVATEIRNDLGASPVWTRSSAGVYVCTLAAAFTPTANTVVEYNTLYTTVVTSVNAITITASGGDGSLTGVLFELTVYAATPAAATYYCTQTDLENRISRLTLAQMTSDTANSTTPDATVVATILARVNAEIDSKAGQVYTVPFTTVPEIIKNIAIDLACYEVFQRRPINMAMPKDWEQARKMAQQQLDDVSNMLVRLPDTATIASTESAINTDNSIPLISFTDQSASNML